MSVLTIRLTEEKHERLKQLAKFRNISLNKLMDELSTIALAEFDTYDMARLFRTLFYAALASFCSYTNGAR